MYCCVDCFTSSYLINIIQSDPRTDNCNFCDSTNVSVYEPRELIHFFKNILNLYKVDASSTKSLIELIEDDFKTDVFSQKVGNKQDLIQAIVSDEIVEFGDLFTNNVSSVHDRVYQIEQAEEIHTIWENFKDEIKNINRFHIKNAIDLKKLKTFFKDEAFHSKIRTGKIFYRSRISDKNGFPPDKMGNPPAEFASSGRANPKGISYLYLADAVLTSIYEARASLYDYVSVADFRLKENITVLNLRQPSYDPISWAEQEAIDDYLIYIPFIKTLQKELSLPIRSRDKEIDYLPTQYLSEFIKSIGFDGVEFQSSLRKEGYNLAIFNPEKFECLGVKKYEISDINLIPNEIS